MLTLMFIVIQIMESCVLEVQKLYLTYLSDLQTELPKLISDVSLSTYTRIFLLRKYLEREIHYKRYVEEMEITKKGLARSINIEGTVDSLSKIKGMHVSIPFRRAYDKCKLYKIPDHLYETLTHVSKLYFDTKVSVYFLRMFDCDTCEFKVISERRLYNNDAYCDYKTAYEISAEAFNIKSLMPLIKKKTKRNFIDYMINHKIRLTFDEIEDKIKLEYEFQYNRTHKSNLQLFKMLSELIKRINDVEWLLA